MTKYYEDLGAIAVHFTDGKTEHFPHAEAGISGNFLIVYQEEGTTVMHMNRVKSWVKTSNVQTT